MPKIEVTYTDGGTAWVDNPNPEIGEIVTLNAVPFSGGGIDDIEAWDDQGYPIALYVQEVQTFTWNYVSMTIHVTFTPPKINIHIDGDGAAYVSNDFPSIGDNVTLHSDPDMGNRVKKIVGYDENGNVVTFRPIKEQEFIWNYQSLDIYITFGRRIPHRMPIEMYPIYGQYT